MKQNSKNRFNQRYPNRGCRPQVILRNTALDSNGPCGKLRGTALQLLEKYQAAAKDAQIQNDAILAETCLQFADHYMRIQNQAIANEEAAKAQTRRPEMNKQPAAPVTDETIEDELPQIDVPNDGAAETGTVSLKETEIKAENTDKPFDLSETPDWQNMDLSVPVQAIQENHADPKPVVRPRLKPRPKKEPAVA